MVVWMWLWKIVFVLSILIFAGMAVWVTIGGASDIKLLFKRLNESHQEDQEQ